MSDQGTITTSQIGKIATIEFSHPAGNSFPSSLLNKLTLQLEELGEDDSVAAIVLRSSGSSFCGGASFSELLAISDLSDGTRFFSGFANVINSIRKCSKLVIGRIHGKAVGGGVGLAAACDYAFATNDSAVKLSELAIGIGPFVIAPAVERKIGINALAQLTLNAEEWKSAEWALDNGLFAEIHQTQQQLDNAITAFTGKLSSYNPEALAQMKKAFWTGTDHWDTFLIERAAISGQLVLSDFTKDALTKFRK